MSPRNVEKDLQLREKRIAHILDSAIEIMAVKGIGSVSMNDIAKSAGVSIGNMYHYFKSKDEIFAELLKRGQTGYGLFVSDLAAVNAGALDKLRHLCASWLAQSNNWAYTILIHTARMSETSSEELRSAVTARFTTNLSPVAQIMAQGQQEGVLKAGDPLQMAFYLVSLIQGLTLQRTPGAVVPVEIEVEGIVSLFQQGA